LSDGKIPSPHVQSENLTMLRTTWCGFKSRTVRLAIHLSDICKRACASSQDRSTSSTLYRDLPAGLAVRPRPFNRQYIVSVSASWVCASTEDRSTSSTLYRDLPTGLAVRPRSFNRLHILCVNRKLDLHLGRDRSTGSTFSPGTASWTCTWAETVQPAAHSLCEPQAGLALGPRPFNRQYILTWNRKLDLHFSQDRSTGSTLCRHLHAGLAIQSKTVRPAMLPPRENLVIFGMKLIVYQNDLSEVSSYML
jgi:hypothetical protein